jgi:hypothetical protein
MKDHQENGHTRPVSDPHKEIRTKTHSNLMNENSSKNTSENHRKRKMPGAKDLARHYGGRFYYEYLSHIRLQATHKKHESWMAKSSHKRATLTSLPPSQRAPQNEIALPQLAKELAEN